MTGYSADSDGSLPGVEGVTRRAFLRQGAQGSALAAAGVWARPLLAQAMPSVEVAYAGSMGPFMEGALKGAVAQSLHLEMRGRGQGANALAQLITSGSVRPDVFVSVTPGPMETVLRAGKAETAFPVARTEMVIAYSPRSRYASGFEAAAKGQGRWWELLEQPGFRFGRSDPATDPQGRNIVFVMMLAAKLYGQPDLVQKTLGPIVNPQQISLEMSVEARLQSGELDAASAYRIQPGPFHLPFLSLPKEINLSGNDVHGEHPEVSLTIGGKTFVPEPLLYYAAGLRDAPNPTAAAAFVKWLRGDQAQALFRQYAYDAPGSAPTLGG